jgi:hypothetical protein
MAAARSVTGQQGKLPFMTCKIVARVVLACVGIEDCIRQLREDMVLLFDEADLEECE